MFRNLFQVLYNVDDASGSGSVPTETTEIVENTDLSGEDELAAAIRSLLEDSEETEEATDETETEEESNEEESEDEVEEEQEEEEVVEEEKPRKRTQTKEENAKFAAERREREMNERVQKELARLREESPEFKLAKQLAERSGLTPELMLEQMREAQLKEEAEAKGVPLELLKERESQNQRVSKLEEELNQLRFQNWQNKIQTDTVRLKEQYKMLTDEDFEQATNYMLNTVRNVDLPLEDAVYAVHGKKIIESLSNAKVQDDLAKQSGRKAKTPPAPNNGKPSKVQSITAEEKYVAQQMGLSEDDYLKYKSM